MSWVLHLSGAALPEPVVEQVRRTVLDGLGAAIAGTDTQAGAISARFAGEQACSGGATVLATGRRVAAPAAVFANVVASNAWDIDDGYRPSKGHPGGFIIMPALAEAELRGPARLVTAIAVGYEIACRAAVATHRYYHHYHASGSWGGLGTVAAIGHMREWDPHTLGSAFGLAEYHAALAPIERCLGAPAMTKDAIGWGAYSGMCAAYLAAAGFKGNPSLLEAQENCDLMEDIGRRWRIRDLYFKPYPCCRWAHQSVDALFEIMRRDSVTEEEVRRIRIHTFKEAGLLSKDVPTTTEEAQYNLFWPVAAALVHGEVTTRQMSQDAFKDTRIVEVMRRIDTVVDPALNARFPNEALCWIEVECVDGRRLRSEVTAARGDAHLPLSTNELAEKFLQLTVPIIGQTAAELMECILAIDTAEGAKKLIASLPVIGQRISRRAPMNSACASSAIQGGTR